MYKREEFWREITWLSQTVKFQHFRPRWRNDLPRPLLFSSFATRFRFNFTYMCDYKPPLTLTSVNVFNQQHIKHILIAPSKTKQKTTSYLATLYLLQEKKTSLTLYRCTRKPKWQFTLSWRSETQATFSSVTLAIGLSTVHVAAGGWYGFTILNFTYPVLQRSSGLFNLS